MSSADGPGLVTMIIVSGSLRVAPGSRTAYLDSCRPVVEQARRTDGCLDFAISADLLDPGRINVLERWTTAAAVAAFRGAGTGDEQQRQLLGAEISEFDASAERRLT